jgi:putative ABC transport system permease protein
MLKLYLKTAWRNLLKHKGFSVINIFGLAFGVSCCLLIFLYVQNELTYDRYHENSNRIYRISSTYITSGEPLRFAGASPALGPRLKEEFPEVEEYVRIYPASQSLFRQLENDITFYEKNIVAADPSLFQVFTYEFIKGDPATCLADPKNIVLTEALAKKYFGDEDPTGKILQVDSDDMIITGVIKTPPQNSHLRIDCIVSYSLLPESLRLNPSMYELLGFTYVLLPENYDLNRFHEKWPAFYEKYCTEDAKSYGQVFQPNFIKLTDIRYGSMNFRFDVPVGSKAYLYAFIFIGIFILALACINYINMTTAQAATRAKEVGIKKVLGSGKRNLVFQILGESFLISFLALIPAFALLELALTFVPFEQLLDFNIELNFLKNPTLLIGTLGFFLFIGLAAGLYPAFYITSVMPVKALSDKFKSGKKGLFIRRVLVTSQFAISIGVVVLMLFMNNQVNFMRNQDLGFKDENIVSIPIRDPSVADAVPALKEELLRYPGVLSIATGNSVPGLPSSGLYMFEGMDGIEEHNFNVFWVGYDYAETLGLELVAGRDFDKRHTSDPDNALIVNETLVKAMKWKNPLGKRITQNRFQAEVIGVVKDFNFRSLHNPIDPLLLRMQPRPGGRLILKIEGHSVVKTISLLEKKWKSISPNWPFEYSFLDEEFGKLYDADQRLNKLVKLFSSICVLISCLGVLGLSSFNSIRRTKEIAIRKIHGASAARIVLILFKEIFFLIITASVIIFPVSLILINLWLRNFAYRADFNIFLFVGTAVGAMLVALFAAGYHCIKVATANPITSIRYE